MPVATVNDTKHPHFSVSACYIASGCTLTRPWISDHTSCDNQLPSGAVRPIVRGRFWTQESVRTIYRGVSPCQVYSLQTAVVLKWFRLSQCYLRHIRGSAPLALYDLHAQADTKPSSEDCAVCSEQKSRALTRFHHVHESPQLL